MEHPTVVVITNFKKIMALCMVVFAMMVGGAAARDAAAENAWQAALPHVPMPSSLLMEESTLTASEAHNWAVSLHNPTTFHSSLFCSQARLHCSSLIRSSLISFNPEDSNYDIEYNNEPPYSAAKQAPPGFFYPLRTLSNGASIIMPNLNHPVPSHQYLPLSISQHLSLTPSSLPDLFRIFGLSNTSQMAHSMAYTVHLCTVPAMEGSAKACTASIEEMIQYVTAQLGFNVDVLESQPSPAYLSKAPEDVKAVVTSRTSLTQLQNMTVVCHKLMFPSMVRLCHNLESTILYEVELMPEGSRSSVKTLTVCHFDTSKWSKGHPSFGMVGTSPGKGEICHWIRSNDYVWIPV